MSAPHITATQTALGDASGLAQCLGFPKGNSTSHTHTRGLVIQNMELIYRPPFMRETGSETTSLASRT